MWCGVRGSVGAGSGSTSLGGTGSGTGGEVVPLKTAEPVQSTANVTDHCLVVCALLRVSHCVHGVLFIVCLTVARPFLY